MTTRPTDAPITATADQFESLSPGMRREILRSGFHWDDFDHARPDPGRYQGTYGPDAELRRLNQDGERIPHGRRM